MRQRNWKDKDNGRERPSGAGTLNQEVEKISIGDRSGGGFKSRWNSQQAHY